MCCKKVVFPAPKNPDIIVTGIGNFPFLSLLLLLVLEEEEEEEEEAIANDCSMLGNRFPLARTDGVIIEVTNCMKQTCRTGGN